MDWFISIVLAPIATLVLSLIGIPVFMFLTLLTMSIIALPPSPLRKKRASVSVVFAMQSAGYALSDLAGLMAGALILQRTEHVNLLPILYAIIALSSLVYAGHRFIFSTSGAQVLNRNQRIANLLGAAVAIVVAIVIRAAL